MIPVALPSLSSILILAGIFLGGLIWLVWTAILLVNRSSRRTLNRRRWLILPYGALGVAAIYAGLFLYKGWRISQEINQSWAATHITLDEPALIGGIDMPAGTKLTLSIADQRESFSEAEFAQAVDTFGIKALRIDRYIHIDTDENFKTIGAYPLNLRIRGEGEASLEGWRCDATSPIEFEADRDGRPASFERCILAEGNQPDGLNLPAGAEIYATGGTTYIDGSVDPDRWVISLEPSMSLRLKGADLAGLVLKLDAERRMLEFERAVLACPLQQGAIHYPAGTELRSVGKGLRALYAGAWVFSPPLGGDAIAVPGHGEIGDDKAIIQSASGDVLAVLPLEEAGIMRFLTIITGEEIADEPALPACP